MGVYRFVYNWTVSKKSESYNLTGKSESYMKDRKTWIADLRKNWTWISEVPAHTVYGAMMDAEKDYNLTISKRVKGLVSELPRCRKKVQKSFFILGNAITPRGIYPRKLGSLRTAEPIPDKPSDSRIMYECGRWYLSTPLKVQVKVSDNQGLTCAIDPGVRTFATIFAQDRITKIGDGAFSRIVRLCYNLDSLMSRASAAPSHKKRSMLKAAARARRKIRRLVTDLHYQAIGWLCRNYSTIVIPVSDFTTAVSRKGRRIRKKTVRALMGWAFATFRKRLIASAQRKGVNVVVVTEEYTSKTANWTGEIVHGLGGRRSIVSQGQSLDRDINGALGIFLRALVDHPVACHRNC